MRQTLKPPAKAAKDSKSPPKAVSFIVEAINASQSTNLYQTEEAFIKSQWKKVAALLTPVPFAPKKQVVFEGAKKESN